MKQNDNHEHDEHCHCGCNAHSNKEHDYEINITTHEMSVICTYKFCIYKSKPETERIIYAIIESIGQETKQAKGHIGHIKAIVKSEGERYRVSLTDEIINKQLLESEGNTIEGVAIVFGLKKERFQQIVDKILSKYL